MKLKSALIASIAAAGIASAADAQVYNGTAHGAIPDNAPGGTSQSIVIADPGSVASLVLSVQLTHTWSGDVDIVLSHNNGVDTVQSFIMSSLGAGTAAAVGESAGLGGTYRFGDSFAGNMFAVGTPLPDAGVIPGGDYRAFTNTFTGTAATSYSEVALNSVFGGRSYAGTWTLNISDNAGLDLGSSSAWSLELTAVPAPGALALLGLAGLVGARRRRA